MTDEQLLALGDFENSPAFTELEKTVLRYAVAMTQTPVDVPDDLFDRLRQHLSSQQLVELTSAIAWENYRARFDHAFGIEAEGFSEGAVCPLPAGVARPESSTGVVASHDA
jgi:4-carboxymuconolactone decarboxylase